MKRKIILQVNGDFGKSFSGLRNYYIYKELIKTYDVIVLCRKNYSKYQDNIIEPIPLKNLIPKFFSFIKKFIFKNFNSSDYSNKLFDYFSKKYIKNVDYIITFPPYINSILEAKKNNIKVIINVNSLDVDYNIKYVGAECDKFRINKIKQIGSIKHNKNVKNCYLNSDYFLFQSNFAIKTFDKRICNFKNLYNIGNTIFFNNNKNLYLTKKKDNKFRILFIGSSMVRKGLYYLIEAFIKLNLNNSELIILGEFVSKDERLFFSKYFKYKNIKFLGYKNPIEYYKYCDLFIFPSLSEGAARVCYEAMGYGLPVISTKESGAPIKNNYIIKSYNSEDIINKILHIKNNNLFYKISNENYKKSNTFNIVKYSENVKKVIDKIVLNKIN